MATDAPLGRLLKTAQEPQPCGCGGDDELGAALANIAALARSSIYNCDEAGVTWSGGGPLRTVAATGAAARAVDEAQYGSGDGPGLAALREGRMVSCKDLPGQSRWPAVAAAARSAGVGSVLSIPLLDGRAVTGALNLYARRTHGFDARARHAAQTLGRQGSITLAHMVRGLRERAEHAGEHRIAETLQRSLLTPLPALPGLACAARYLPAPVGGQVGGDWYDLFALADGSIGMAIGDVSGHDTAAAAAMGQVRSVLRSYAYEGSTPAAVLERLDRYVDGFDVGQLVTAFYARLTPTRQGLQVAYSNAGHPPALLRLPGGRVHRLDGASGALIGLPAVARRPRPQARTELPVGATLLLCTDGLLEARVSGRRRDVGAGVDQLAELLARSDPADPERLCDQILSAMLPGDPEDDVALLAVHATGTTDEQPNVDADTVQQTSPRGLPAGRYVDVPSGAGVTSSAPVEAAQELAHLLASAERASSALCQRIELSGDLTTAGPAITAARRCRALIQDALLLGAIELATILEVPEDALPD